MRIRPKAQVDVPHTRVPFLRFWRRRVEKDPAPQADDFDLRAVQDRRHHIDELAGLGDGESRSTG